MEWDVAQRLFSDADMVGINNQLSSLIDQLNARSAQALQKELQEPLDAPS